MKDVMIVGVGAQGSTIAKRLNEDENVARIICADCDEKAAQTLARNLDKAVAAKVDANDVQDITRTAQGADIMVNGLPIQFNLNVMEAALSVGASYQDLCMTEVQGMDSEESTRFMFTRQDERFREKGLVALTNTGSAPGLANVMAKEACHKLDACDRIEINIYEGVWSKKFIPFWWSPEVAFTDMAENPIRFENGKIVETTPFANPVHMRFEGVDKVIRMVDHCHEEPITMGINADAHLKGVKDIIFRYGGPHVELAEGLYKMGFLSFEPAEHKGMTYIPFDLVVKNAPRAPKYKEEIQAIIDGGLVSEEGAFQVLVEGKKDNQTTRITSYALAPGLVEAFHKSGLSHESYLTGQCAFIFTKMLVNDVVEHRGVIAPEAFSSKERAFFFNEAKKLDIQVKENVEYLCQ